MDEDKFVEWDYELLAHIDLDPFLANIRILYPFKPKRFLVFSGGMKFTILSRNHETK